MLFTAVSLLCAASALQLCAADAGNAPISSAGWTATASSQETRRESGVASNVLDGDPSTIWHSKWSSKPPAPLPHWIKIEMTGGPYNVSGLSYSPRQDGNANGRIGEFSIEVFTSSHVDGKEVANGDWADDASTKVVEFTVETDVHAIKLTALTEAGGRGPWSSASEIEVLEPTISQAPDCGGENQPCCEPGQFGSDSGGCLLLGTTNLTCVPEVYGPSLGNTCQPCGGQADFCCTGDSGPATGCGPGLSCEDSECEDDPTPACGGENQPCCAPGEFGSDSGGCFVGSTNLTCVPEVYGPGLANTCQPCGGQADFCCTGDSGPAAGCGPNLSCEDSECEIACGKFPGDPCCEPGQFGSDASGCFDYTDFFDDSLETERLVCAPENYGDLTGTCQPCGGSGDFCCAENGACDSGFSCEDSECEPL